MLLLPLDLDMGSHLTGSGVGGRGKFPSWGGHILGEKFLYTIPYTMEYSLHYSAYNVTNVLTSQGR